MKNFINLELREIARGFLFVILLSIVNRKRAMVEKAGEDKSDFVSA